MNRENHKYVYIFISCSLFCYPDTSIREINPFDVRLAERDFVSNVHSPCTSKRILRYISENSENSLIFVTIQGNQIHIFVVQ